MKKRLSLLQKKSVLIAISVLMILVMILGGFLGSQVATDGGNVSMSEVSFYGSKDNIVSAYLFQPATASAENKAPGIMLAYGGTGLKDFMVNISIELARRGFVALSVDTNGCGATELTSSSVAVDALAYLRSQSCVDTDRIGLVAQSMGRNFLQEAASAQPDWYSSCAFLGITPTGGDEVISALKNMLIVFGTADETNEDLESYAYATRFFENPLWQRLIVNGQSSSGTVEEHTVYGSIEDGTARMLVSPNIDHAQTTESTKSVAAVVEWMQMTLDLESKLPASSAVFPWKQFWVSVSFLAMVIFLFAAGSCFVLSDSYAGCVTPMPVYKGAKGAAYWVGAIVTTLLGPIVWAASWQLWPLVSGFNAQLPFGFANNYASWFMVLFLITVVILAVNFFLLRKKGFTFSDTGLACGLGDFARQLGMAVFLFAVVYMTAVFIYGKYKMPITLSGIPIPIMFRPLDGIRLPYLLNYTLVYLPYYLSLGVLLFGFLRPKNGTLSLGKEMVVNSLVLSVGPVLFLLGYYAPLYLGMGFNPLYDWWQAVSGVPSFMGGFFGIIMIYMIPVPIMNTLTACMMTYFNRKTGKVWFSAILMALLFAWMQVSTVNFAGALIG